MTDFPLLSILTFAPLAGALIILLLIHGEGEQVNRNYRWAAL